MLQKWKLNIDAAAYERNIDAIMSKPSENNKLTVIMRDLYLPSTMRDTIQCFPYLYIMEHTRDILNPKLGLIN